MYPSDHMDFRRQRRELLLKYHPDKNYGDHKMFHYVKNKYPFLFKTSFMYSFDELLDKRGIDFNDVTFLKNKNLIH